MNENKRPEYVAVRYDLIFLLTLGSYFDSVLMNL